MIAEQAASDAIALNSMRRKLAKLRWKLRCKNGRNDYCRATPTRNAEELTPLDAKMSTANRLTCARVSIYASKISRTSPSTVELPQ